MSGLTPPGPGPGAGQAPGPGSWSLPEAIPLAHPGAHPGLAPDDGAKAEVRDGLTTLSVVIGWFAVAAVLGALIWWQVTPLAEYTRTRDNATMDEEQLAKQFGADGWFFVIAAAGGVVSGFALALLRRRNPVLLVLLLVVGGALATFLMAELGLLLGPADPSSVLASTPVGGKVPLQLEVDARGIWFVWSIAALVGGLLALWILESRETSRLQQAADRGYITPADAAPNHR